jgi:hypothetical protein
MRERLKTRSTFGILFGGLAIALLVTITSPSAADEDATKTPPPVPQSLAELREVLEVEAKALQARGVLEGQVSGSVGDAGTTIFWTAPLVAE